MRPVSSPAPQRSAPDRSADAGAAGNGDEWGDRAGRLYIDLEVPARGMVRRAFGGAFSDDELDDIYSNAWVGTLRALRDRHAEMSDEEVRKYLLAAVANQASKELRRRRRKPTAPFDSAWAVPDDAGTPDERVVGAERSRVVRDVLASLPARRRAVMLLRYGLGLEPRQVCDLVEGLSLRAYRKEVTRGVDEVAERMRRVESGEWCAEREPLLKAYAAGLLGADERRQARAHLSHCQQCSDFVARLSGHLHDLGAGAAAPGTLEALDRDSSLGERLGEAGERFRDAIGGALSRGGESVHEVTGQAMAAGGPRGVGTAAGAGVLAKLTGIGAAGKVALACLGGGAAATACVSAGVVPGLGLPGAEAESERSAPRVPGGPPAASPDRTVAEADVGGDAPAPGADLSPPPPEPEQQALEPELAVEPVAPTAPPTAQEFGVAAAASPGGGGSTGTTAGSGSGGGGGSGGSAVRQEFGGP